MWCNRTDTFSTSVRCLFTTNYSLLIMWRFSICLFILPVCQSKVPILSLTFLGIFLDWLFWAVPADTITWTVLLKVPRWTVQLKVSTLRCSISWICSCFLKHSYSLGLCVWQGLRLSLFSLSCQSSKSSETDRNTETAKVLCPWETRHKQFLSIQTLSSWLSQQSVSALCAAGGSTAVPKEEQESSVCF